MNNNYALLYSVYQELSEPDKWWNGRDKCKSGQKCILMSLHHNNGLSTEARDYLELIAGERLEEYNDSHTYIDMLNLIDRGIEHFKHDIEHTKRVL